MKQHTIDEQVLSGRAYDIDEDTTLYVFPGVAYRRKPIGGAPYYTSIDPLNVADMTADRDGRSVEETIYTATSRAYIAADTDVSNSYGVVDYLYDDRVYQYDETLTAYDEPVEFHDGTPTVDGTEYVRLTNGWSDVDDEVFPKTEFDAAVDDGTIRCLWPIWNAAHR